MPRLHDVGGRDLDEEGFHRPDIRQGSPGEGNVLHPLREGDSRRLIKGCGMERPYRCPVCNAPLEEDKDAGFKIPPQCPYSNTPYPEYCALHDKLYFGKWRKMDAEPDVIKRAYAKLDRLLSRMKYLVGRENVEPARQNIRKAVDAFGMADVDGDPYSSIKFMDQALSYVHHAINDLLEGKKAKLHSPADYERHYDVILPFKEDL